MMPMTDRRRKSLFDIMVPTLVGIVTVLIGVIGAGIINALHDLTTEVRDLSGKLAAVEANQTNDRDRRTLDERAIGQLQVDVQQIKESLMQHIARSPMPIRRTSPIETHSDGAH
jgi:hypothetical protein